MPKTKLSPRRRARSGRRQVAPSRGRPRHVTLWGALFLLLAACVLCWPVLAGQIMVPTDNLLTLPPWRPYARDYGLSITQNEMLDPIQQYLPWRHFAVDSVRAGTVPLWNPYSGCGAPFLANLQSTLFYPPNALFLLTGPGRGFGISALLHVFLGGFFMFGFLRALHQGPLPALVGAVVFSLNGFVVTWLEYPTLGLWTTVWLPLALWLLELSLSRRHWGFAVGCGAVIGLDLLGGHLQVSTYVLLAVVLYALLRGVCLRQLPRAAVTLVGATALGVGLASGQLLPTLELAGNSLRGAPNAQQALATALPWNHLVVYLLPGFFGSPHHHNYWGNLGSLPINFFETAGYAGVLTLLLAGYGLFSRPADPEGAAPATGGRPIWRQLGLLAFPASFFALVLALALLVALGTPVYYMLYYAVPGFGQLRGLARILFLAAFALAGLSSLGLQALMSRRRGRAWPALLAAAIMVVGGVSATLLFGSRIRAATDFAAYFEKQWLLFVVLVVTAALLVSLRQAGKLPPAWFGSLALLHVACDLLIVGVGFNPAVDPALDFFPTKTTTLLQERIGAARMTSIGSAPWHAMLPNTPLAYRLRDVHNYDSLVPANYERMVVAACGNEQFRWPLPGDEFLNLAGVSYLLTDTPIVFPGWEQVGLSEGLNRVYYNPNALPRAYLWSAGPAPVAEGEVQFEEDGPDRVRLSVDSPAPSRLVLSDTSYPGWHVWVDGRPATVLEAPPLFRAVEVGPGAHHVVWQYEPASFRVGVFVSLLALAVLAGAASTGLARRRSDR